MQSSLMQLEELQSRICGHLLTLLGGQQGTPCQTLGGLEGQFQHIPNFNRIQLQHLIDPILLIQAHTLHHVLRCILQQGALQHVLQGALLFILQGSLQGALLFILQGSLQDALLFILQGSLQGALQLVLRCILQGALHLQGALQLVLRCILQGALQLVAHGSPQGVPLSVLFGATGRGASDNRTSLLYL